MQHSIGDGTTTVLSDNWLPTLPPRLPRLLPYTNPTLPVNVLIDRSTNTWDARVLAYLIEQSDISFIKKLYLPPIPAPDGFLCPYTTDGNYTVKSGYHFITTNHQPDVIPPPLASSPELTKQIWSSSLPPKLRHFFWRMGSRILAVKENFHHRHIPVDPMCALCCNEEETSNHVFFTCPYAQQVWRLSSCPPSFTDQGTNMLDKLKLLFDYLNDDRIPKEQRLLPVWIVWRLWKSRNEVLFSNKVNNTQDVITKAREDVQEWISSTQKISTPSTTTQRTNLMRTQWRPPGRGWIKCNYDASHHEGHVLLEAGMGKFEGRSSVIESELTALIWSLQSCSALGYKRVIFEGDNISVLKYLNNGIYGPWFTHLLSTIDAWKTSFTSIRFAHVKRCSISCADLLAKKAILSPTDWNLFLSCPPFLYNNVFLDNNQ
ncbi:hypothetical protein Bca52824_000937 [Brassica carinata]|uniref:Reverse transcriptase zinc-binding domain-containing protein n=1 Tax=Brassica carinata TaxID=52824 RepID=A0A8X8BDB5_BRACI|nr:hypothetical protein Bca52824_000937 [Brassica carinata]